MYATVYIEETALPPQIRALSRLTRVDYSDAFRLVTPHASERTGEAWARAMLEDAPAATRQALRDGWRGLGLRLGPTEDAARILGWPVRASAPDHAVLATTSCLGMRAELVFLRQPDALRFSTLIAMHNPITRLVWAGIERKHRRVVRDLLEQVAQRQSRMSK